MRINFNSINTMLNNVNNEFNIDAKLLNYSDMHDAMSTTKVFRNYTKLYVNDKIALELKFDKNSFEFKEFMCDAKRSRYVAEKLVNVFRDKLDFRFTKKQTFVTCNDMYDSLFDAIIYNAVMFALMYDNDATASKLYKTACNKRTK